VKIMKGAKVVRVIDTGRRSRFLSLWGAGGGGVADLLLLSCPFYRDQFVFT